MPTPLDDAARLADTVLFGSPLGTGPTTVRQDRLRRPVGALLPPSPASTVSDASRSRLECLLEGAAEATLRVRLRFLHVRATTVHDTRGRPVAELVAHGVRLRPREEGLLREIDAEFPVAELCGGRTATFGVPDELAVSPVVGGSLRQRSRALTGHLEVSAEPAHLPGDLLRLRLDVVNDTRCPPGADRDTQRRCALVAAHVLLTVTAGRFVSAAAPPRGAAAAARQLRCERTWPVLVGRGDVLLASPIPLPDCLRPDEDVDDEPGARLVSHPHTTDLELREPVPS